jgi:hypothetical protein
MQTKTDVTTFVVKDQYETIGQGEMIHTPCQIGEWWVMPIKDYKGKIPTDIQNNLNNFLSQGNAIQGLLVAEDIRVIEAEREQERRRRETIKKAVVRGLEVTAIILTILAKITFYSLMVVLSIISACLTYDPMLIAVTKSGEYICLGTWYD